MKPTRASSIQRCFAAYEVIIIDASHVCNVNCLYLSHGYVLTNEL